MDEVWFALQICDASFGGSLSHSMGLESAIHHNIVSKASPQSLEKHIILIIEQTVQFTLPFIQMTFHATSSPSDSHDVAVPTISILPLCEIENSYHASTTNEINRRSSLNQGRIRSLACIASFFLQPSHFLQLTLIH